jgi:gas vesicle protein
MYPNLIRPFIDWTNAQVETFTRFAKAPEIAELTRSNIENFWQLVRESQSRIFQSRAFTEWNKANVENFSRLAQEYSRTLSDVASQAQTELTRGIQEGTRRLQQVANTASNIAATAADETGRAVKASAEEVAEETDVAKAKAGRRHG